MKILVVGAGVLGSLYAARLQEAGNAVTILARGERAVQLRENGIVLEEAETGIRTATRVEVIEHLAPDAAYDLAIVLVRKNQLTSVLEILKPNEVIGSILFMVNTVSGPQEMIDAVGSERVLLGFPGAGGQREKGVVRYQIVSGSTQPTNLGELFPGETLRIKMIAEEFQKAGFPVAIQPHMDAWLKTHVALVSPIANALYLAGGDNYRLSQTRDGLVLTVRAIREGLRVVRAAGAPVTPAFFRVIEWVPEPLLVAFLAKTFNTAKAELVMARHANAARDEMSALAADFMALARKTGVRTPAIDALAAYIDPQVPPVQEGSKKLSLDWRSLIAVVLAAAGVVGAILAITQCKKMCCGGGCSCKCGCCRKE